MKLCHPPASTLKKKGQSQIIAKASVLKAHPQPNSYCQPKKLSETGTFGDLNTSK